MSMPDVSDLYQDIILDRARNPRHMRCLEPCDASACGENPMCGDRVEVRVILGQGLMVSEAAYEARGCAISMASADLMADVVRGRTPEEISRLAEEFSILATSGQSPRSSPDLDFLMPLSGVSAYKSRIKCATLPWSALIAALAKLPGDSGRINGHE